MKNTDILPSKQHIHTKLDYNFRVFTASLKLIQIPLGKKGARLYLRYFVALNFGFRNKFKVFKQKKVSLENVKTQIQFINLLTAVKDTSLERPNTLSTNRCRC